MMKPESGIESLSTDLTEWEVGPYYHGLPGPLRIRMKLDGETIVHSRIESGYLHRGLEKAFELHTWQSSMPYADRLDPDAAVFGELALCLATEEILEISTPPRAQAIRVILSELCRIASHLAFVARMGKVAGTEAMMHFALRDRERILDLQELLTGARFTANFLRFGGVASDVTEGFVERVLEVCELIRFRLKEYNDLFSYYFAFVQRTRDLARADEALIRKYGITGPNARASGVALDTRKNHPYSGYDRYNFELVLGYGSRKNGGDHHDRFLLRLREISQSTEILKQVVESIPQGPYSTLKIERGFQVPRGEAYARVESPRGMLGCYVVSDGSERPARVQFRTPSLNSLQIAPVLLVGTQIEDLPLILSGLDLSIAEVDR